ncbi:hypothetical protein FKM82_000619 [Ascaphus truei]
MRMLTALGCLHCCILCESTNRCWCSLTPGLCCMDQKNPRSSHPPCATLMPPLLLFFSQLCTADLLPVLPANPSGDFSFPTAPWPSLLVCLQSSCSPGIGLISLPVPSSTCRLYQFSARVFHFH